MNEERMVEALSAYTERLTGRSEGAKQINLTEEESDRLAPLFQLAEWLQRSMQPMEPAPAFVRSLGSELVDGAKHRTAQKKRMRRVTMIGAAVLGSIVSIASVVGAIVVLIKWLRTRTQAHPAPTG